MLYAAQIRLEPLPMGREQTEMDKDKPYTQLQNHVQHKQEKLLRKKIHAMLNCLEKGPQQGNTATNSSSSSSNNNSYSTNYSNNYNNSHPKTDHDRSQIPPHRRSPDEQQALTHALTEVTDLERTLLQADKDAIGFATKILDAVGDLSLPLSCLFSMPLLSLCLFVCLSI